MKKNMRLLSGAAAAVVLIAGGWMVFGHHPDDNVQIKTALTNALEATKEARPGGVVEYLASDVVVNGQHYNVDRQFSGFIRKYHPDITVDSVEPQISGESATLTTNVHFSVLKENVDLPNVTFTFKKLHDTKWLVFPSQDWKITGASAPEQAYEQLVSQLALDGDFASGSGLW